MLFLRISLTFTAIYTRLEEIKLENKMADDSYINYNYTSGLEECMKSLEARTQTQRLLRAQIIPTRVLVSFRTLLE